MKILKTLLAIAIAMAGLIATQNDAAAQGFFATKDAQKLSTSRYAKYTKLAKALEKMPGSFLLGYSEHDDSEESQAWFLDKEGSLVIYIWCRSTKPCWPACGIYGTNRLTFSESGFGTQHVFTFYFSGPGKMLGKTYKYYINTFEGIGNGVPMKVKWAEFTVPEELQ